MVDPTRASRIRVTRRALTLALTLALALGCSSTPRPVRFLIEPVIAPRANLNSPVPLAIVAITDAKLLDHVITMTAKQWFEQREQIRRDYPGGDAFTEWEWEYVPGQAPPLTVIEVDGRSAGAVIFANYRTPGDHRLRIGPQRKLRIELGAEDVTVTPLTVPDH